MIFSAWTLDFVIALVFGILFQSCSIKPMHPELSRSNALKRALEADTLSLIAWQIGMYALMAVAHFWGPRVLVGHAVCNDRRLLDLLSSQSLADRARHQGGDVDSSRCLGAQPDLICDAADYRVRKFLFSSSPPAAPVPA
jgi:hypothetical protein